MLTPQRELELLKVLWRRGRDANLLTPDGRVVEVRSNGEYCEESDRFIGGEIAIEGALFRGDVVISNGSESKVGYENCILQVAPKPSPVILNYSGEPLLQAILSPDREAKERYAELCRGAGQYGCAGYIAEMESYQRVGLYTRLLVERLRRKQDDVVEIFNECQMNWNQAMYTMLLRTMGDNRNKEAFTELARRVSYINIARERTSIQYIEAMLLGASGLLEIYEEDIYTRKLKESFQYLQRKYSIKPMLAGQWNLYRIRAANHPVLRIAQLSTFLASEEFMFDRMMKIDSVCGVLDFFRSEASHYWSSHTIPGGDKSADIRPKRVGVFKAEILGINLVVPMMFAYGDYTNDEGLKERAIGLLEKIKCEKNYITRGWQKGGVVMESSFDSQAIIQLNNEYCKESLCWRCPVGRRVIDGLFSVS